MKKNKHYLNLFYFSNHINMKIYLVNFKIQIRNFLISNSKKITSIKVVLGCFPIVFGVSKTFYSKHQDQIFSNLLNHTLPGLSPLSIQVSWPTLEQIFLQQLQFGCNEFQTSNIPKSYIKRVDFYTDSISIQTNSNWYTKQKQINMGAFTSLKQADIENTKQIGNNWYTVFSKKKNLSNFVNKTQKRKNWNLYPTYDRNNILPLHLNKKLNSFGNKNNSIFHLDELPNKLNWSSSLKKQFFPNVLENPVSLTKVKFGLNKEKMYPKKLQKNDPCSRFFFSADKLIILNTNIQSPIRQKKILFFSQKILNTKIQNSLVYDIKKPKFYCSFPVLKGIHNHILQNKIQWNKANPDCSNLADRSTLGVYSNFLENKLKENLYSKNLLPFSNFHNLCFSTNLNLGFQQPKVAALVKQKNLKVDINVLVEWIYSKAWVLSSTELLDLLELIEEIGVFHENCVITPTGMSGYISPDTSNEQNVSLVVQFLYKSKNQLLHTIFSNSFQSVWNPRLQINLPKTFSYSFNFVNSTLSSRIFVFSPQSQNVEYFFPSTHFKTIYDGPSVGQNTIPNELNSINPTQLKQWIKQFLNSDTILSDRREIFFGKNVYAGLNHKYNVSNSTYSSKAQSKLKKMKHIQKGLFKQGKTRPLQFFEMPLKSTHFVKKRPYKKIVEPRSIISYDEYPYIIYLSQKEWEIFSEKLSEEKNELIPIENVKFPKKKWNIWSLNQSNSENVNNLISFKPGKKNRIPSIPFPIFSTSPGNNKKTTFFSSFPTNKRNQIENENCVSNFLQKPNFGLSDSSISYHYFPYSPTLVKEVLPTKYFFGNTYKKNFSIYSNENLHTNKFNALFYDSVEPINTDSWLFCAQFSVGLFLLHVLQNIFQKYGKELKYGISTLVEGKSETSTVIDGTVSEKEVNFRIIQNIETNFHNIAGIDILLPELSEIVWFLRNSGRSFKIGNTIPRRILLTGLPGTGKTLLVQAIAGEAEVPVLIESGSALNKPGSSESGSERLQNIFRKAREIAPCIVFIDEIDSFGEARNQMIENPIVKNEILDSISLYDTKLAENTFQVENFDFMPKSKFSAETKSGESAKQSDLQNDSLSNSSNDVLNQVNTNTNQKNSNKYSATLQKANILLQFLIELDGIATDKNILVFGATNRPQVLDAALTRPGRFNKVFKLNLPNKQKRIEILKLYSKNLGVDIHISWSYLANLTSGLSAADLASVMNQSSIKAIQTETIHTVETIEYGIESITGYTTQKNQFKSFIQLKKNELGMVSQSVFINRLAYYQSGKAVVHTLLENHPQVVSISLWPEIKNTRYHLVHGIIEKEFSQIRTRIQLESRIIGFYAGKAAEMVALFHTFPEKKKKSQPTLSSNSSASLNSNLANSQLKNGESFQNFKSYKKYNEFKQTNKTQFFCSYLSDLGVQDMSFAGWLAQLMVNKWYFYSKQISIEKVHEFQNNSNLKNIADYEMVDFFKQLSDEIENQTNRDTISVSENSQNWITSPWLQKQIIKKLEFSYLNNSNWYKIYEGDHEQNENTRCVPPDEYYHSNTYFKNLLNNKPETMQTIFSTSVAKQYIKQNTKKTFLKSSLTWLDITVSNHYYFYHSLILACFNKSMSILDQNREVLDFFASYLIQKEIIREDEVTTIINNFKKNKTNTDSQQNLTSEFSNIDPMEINTKPITKKTEFVKKTKKNTETSLKKAKLVVEKNLNKRPGKKHLRFINFENL